ncbi:unnamed protein product [Didymodactylos carnosus]|uniref:Metallo-beta-lactamase domain-containing protein n=1 Tax=Didymodactylos carnosus TaxID=1234261 RepID=A0A814CV45_9BILA|nr:unnamed protein product [Didymodactylos carnosus]CAF0945757.1 unnamed protein product [Didymodactylos carnosus]CAF3667430.1 unnamed protein product [Didymodactylos carnosus]CAF3721920.1 unnamed protein product [Didymodactylos carnosus]
MASLSSLSDGSMPEWCRKLPRPQYASLEQIHVRQQWFQVYKVYSGVYAIYEPYHWEEVISYLIYGSHKNLLLDTGMGIGNIKQVVDELTAKDNIQLPLSVISSHTHHDHIGDNWQFEDIYGIDTNFTRTNMQGNDTDAQAELEPGMIWKKYLPSDFDPKSYRIRPFQIKNYLRDGDKIDMGNNRRLEILTTPGHTPDCISLFDEQNGLLFVGDTFYLGPIFLYRPETNLHEYAKSLEKLAQLCSKVKIIFPAHNIPVVEPDLLIKAAQGIKNVMSGKLKPNETDKEHDVYSFEEFSFVLNKGTIS